MKNYKIDPIQRSVSVSKKIKDISVCYEKPLIEIYKKNRKVVEIEIGDLKELFKQVGIRL